MFGVHDSNVFYGLLQNFKNSQVMPRQCIRYTISTRSYFIAGNEAHKKKHDQMALVM